MTMDEINKRYEELKYTKTCIERAMEKFRGTNNIDNYLSYDVLRYQAGILGHSMTEMKAFFTSGFNTLKKNRINGLSSGISNICKKS